MPSSLIQQVRKLRTLDAAWRSVRTNGLSSKSEAVQKEIQQFDEDPSGKLRSLQSRLVHNSFGFPAARGVPIQKPNKKGIRPLVVAGVETRIVQRAILDVLQGVAALQPYFRNPHSFGGIKRRQEDELAAVPAAIQAVLGAIGEGGRYVVCADISAFFTRISKSAVAEIVEVAVAEPEFMALFRRAIHVELSNLAALREHAVRFPTEDIGVAQGSALSPLLGNIILADFDARMNAGDCRCLRYIDDFIVIGPSAGAVMARVRLAKQILAALGMEFALDKTSPQAIPVTRRFEFLGIELNNGFIRPAAKARIRFLEKLRGTFDDGRKALVAYRNGQPLPKSAALLGTLKRADGIIQGWGKHYRFCNDGRCFETLDAEVVELVRDYLGFYGHERRGASATDAPAMLGVDLLATQERRPFVWPKLTAEAPEDRPDRAA